jgi:uncharacterized membrane protein YedE/YeeE
MLETLLERFGDGTVLMLGGGLVGLLFGAAAQHSRFCLRAATVEVAEGGLGPRLAIWLVAFTGAVLFVQGAVVLGLFDASGSRQIAATGSLSGALIGGLMFGAGMILARGCASRLLVLSATGNLRALVTGLVLTLVAQASLSGVLAPAREALSALWTVPGGAERDLLARLGLSHAEAALAALTGTGLAVGFAVLRGVAFTRWMAALLVGVAVGLGWLLTYRVSQVSFEVVPVSSITFTGPSTDTLLRLVVETSMPAGFGLGLVPGVALGAALAAVLTREFRIERFGPDTPMESYLVGAFLMGFGAMLAGGCAVGAGMSGGAIFSLTAWVAVFAMWVGAMSTHRILQAAAGTPKEPLANRAASQPPARMEASAKSAAMLPVATPERPAPTVQPPASTPPTPMSAPPAR